jgi:hypothetical protein
MFTPFLERNKNSEFITAYFPSGSASDPDLHQFARIGPALKAHESGFVLKSTDS